mgnify:CR=1 FL=1
MSRAGSKLGPYRLHELINSGGMSEIWLATDDAGRQYALRFLLNSSPFAFTEKKRFNTGCEVLQAVHGHELVIGYVEHGKLDRYGYGDGPLREEQIDSWTDASGSPAVIIAGAGFSFDWSAVQDGVAAFTRVCTYDPAGTVWSDPGPGRDCRAFAQSRSRPHAAGQRQPGTGPRPGRRRLDRVLTRLPAGCCPRTRPDGENGCIPCKTAPLSPP